MGPRAQGLHDRTECLVLWMRLGVVDCHGITSGVTHQTARAMAYLILDLAPNANNEG